MNIKHLVTLLALTTVSSNVYAYDDGESMEVTAPNECCEGLPAGLSSLSGWGPVGAVGAASIKSAAYNAAKGKVKKSKDKHKTEAKAKKQKSFWEKMLGVAEAIGEWASSFGGDTTTPVVGPSASMPGSDSKIKKMDRYKYTDPDTGATYEHESIRECEGDKAYDPESPCVREQIEEFVDPMDGNLKFSYTLSVVKSSYNPKHYDADKDGYAPITVDNQSITLVFETYDDLNYQLAQLRAIQ